MSRLPPSQDIAQKVAEFMEKGVGGETDVTGALVRLGAQRLIQEMLEAESTDFLGRGHYERRQEGEEHKGYRNGYAKRSVRTAEGKIPVYVPELRDTQDRYRSKLMEFLKANSDVLRQLIVEMYARGLSDRDIEDTFKDVTGECMISKSGVSRVTESLWDDYEAFSERDLSGFKVEYLFLDAVYESLREQAGVPEGILCGWGVVRDGRKVLLHMALGNKESHDAWLEFLRDMVKRGLGVPLTVTTDGAPGLTKAVEAIGDPPKVGAESLRVRCWAHKLRNVLDKVRVEDQVEVKTFLLSIRDAANEKVGRIMSDQFVQTFQGTYPSAVKTWMDDVEASLTHLQLPPLHRMAVRTTNLIERSFEEERRRTKVIPRFFDEKGCLKLVFASLWRASQRWQKVKFSQHEQAQIRRLRIALGIDDPRQNQEQEPAPGLAS
jgi:transposase-like protein